MKLSLAHLLITQVKGAWCNCNLCYKQPIDGSYGLEIRNIAMRKSAQKLKIRIRSILNFLPLSSLWTSTVEIVAVGVDFLGAAVTEDIAEHQIRMLPGINGNH